MYWPAKSTEPIKPRHADGTPPILVIGTTGDPASPYKWSENLASQLNSGALLTYTQESGSAFGQGNACVNKATESYLVSGVVPKNGATC